MYVYSYVYIFICIVYRRYTTCIYIYMFIYTYIWYIGSIPYIYIFICIYIYAYGIWAVYHIYIYSYKHNIHMDSHRHHICIPEVHHINIHLRSRTNIGGAPYIYIYTSTHDIWIHIDTINVCMRFTMAAVTAADMVTIYIYILV